MSEIKQRDCYPVNREEDGWHWLLLCGENVPEPNKWIAKRQQWFLPDVGIYNSENVANEMSYCGPCILYADAFTAGARAAREMDVEYMRSRASKFFPDEMQYFNTINSYADAIQSLPLPSGTESETAQPVVNADENISASVDLSGLEELADLWERSEDEWVDADSCCLKLLRSCKDELRAEIEKLKGK